MRQSEFLVDLEKYIAVTFEKLETPELAYHGLNHTRKVVFHVREIAKHYLLNDHDSFIVECAAWFHDFGYLIDRDPFGHELRGANHAEVFLKNSQIADETITEIRLCILATALPQNPHTLLQKIVCDADLYHLGTTDFFSQDELIHQEVEMRLGKKIEMNKWVEVTIRLLESHWFHTDYCRKLLNDQKRLNLNELYASIGRV